MKSNEIYIPVDGWKRLEDGTLARYRCFQVLPQGRYCVQSVDFYRFPFNIEQRQQLDEHFLYLLREDAPSKRSQLFNTLEEAIDQHDLAFRDMEEE